MSFLKFVFATFLFICCAGDAAAIIAADEESFNREHELEIPVCDSLSIALCSCQLHGSPWFGKIKVIVWSQAKKKRDLFVGVIHCRFLLHKYLLILHCNCIMCQSRGFIKGEALGKLTLGEDDFA